MFELLMDDFFQQAKNLCWHNDFEQLEKLLDENRHKTLCHHPKAVAMYEAICFYRLRRSQNNDQIIQNFEKALQLQANLEVETLFLNAQIYCEMAAMYSDLLNQLGKGVKLHKKAEKAFDRAIELYGQFYKRNWQHQRYFTEVYILIQYNGAKIYMGTVKSDTARDYTQKSLDMCRQTHSSFFKPHCYIMKAMYASRRRSAKKCQEALAIAKVHAEDQGITDRLKDYFKMMERIIELNEKGKWWHKGKMLVEYDPHEIYNIYRQFQRDEVFAYGIE